MDKESTLVDFATAERREIPKRRLIPPMICKSNFTCEYFVPGLSYIGERLVASLLALLMGWIGSVRERRTDFLLRHVLYVLYILHVDQFLYPSIYTAPVQVAEMRSCWIHLLCRTIRSTFLQKKGGKKERRKGRNWVIIPYLYKSWAYSRHLYFILR